MRRCIGGRSILLICLFYFENLSDASYEKAPHQEEEVKGSHPLAQWFVGRRGTEIFEGLKTLQS